MFKKAIWVPILTALAWVTSLAGIVVLMSFIGTKEAGVVCTNVIVYIPGSQYFIDKDEVDNILQIKSKALVGNKMADINIHNLESKLKANPFIEFAKVYMEMDGIIHVEISQRQPILRIVNKYDQDFYIDQHGLKIPLSANFTAKVLVATGAIDELFASRVDSLHTAMAKDLFKTADFIRRDSLWSAQIVQINVNAAHEIELVPRVGSHTILLGNADSLNVKFGNLLVFYKQAMPRIGPDAYKTINIKYANQIVGIRNEVVKKDTVKKAIVAIKTDSVKIKNEKTTLIQH